MAIPATGAAPPANGDQPAVDDNLSSPLADAQAELKQRAQQLVLSGKANVSGDGVVEVAHGQFVELARQDEDMIWTTLGEFADLSHNNIPEPDRSVDNTTYWVDDFNVGHYQDMLFNDSPGANSMRNFYIEQSSNRYTVDGEVEDWVGVPGNQADYAYPNFAATWDFVDQSVDAWYDGMIADGMTADDINDYLSQFDTWDRYDYDSDGNFNEPDGYIDHYQALHAGGGAEAGVPNAIWSHRWYVQLTPIGTGGPTVDGSVVPFGGTQIGGSDYWVGDYTTEPENGAVGVFAHEFGHDLGLPDLYNTGSGPENSTGFWTLMSSGSWTSENPDYIGTKPTHMGAWEKFQLGWLNYEVAFADTKSSHKLGPASTNTKQAQGLFVVLPDKQVDTVIADPYAGDNFYYSGAGNDLDNVMYREVNLPASAELTAQVNYDIEVDWDYAYVVVSTDGGATWEGVPTDHSDEAGSPNGQDFGHGISGSTGGSWELLTADLSAYTGTVLVGFRYWTDGAVVGSGFMADDITIAGEGPFGAEADGEFVLEGFRTTTGEETTFHFNAYVAEFRNYRGYDDALRTGPYNFGFLDNPLLGNWVEYFSYEDGLLISYWDSSYTDNNTASHPGEGLILPIDAHPDALIRADGGVWRNRVQAYDSTFGLEPTTEITLHWLSEPSTHPSLPAESVFDDNKSYFDPSNPTGSVDNPHTDTQIAIRSVSAQGNFMQVQVR